MKLEELEEARLSVRREDRWEVLKGDEGEFWMWMEMRGS